MHRRALLKSIAVTLHGAIAVLLGIPAVRFLFDPFRRKRGEADFIRVARLSALSGNKPVRAVVRDARQDTFIHYPPGPVGSVWLVPAPDEATPPCCLQTICPHLGCGIDFADGPGVFTCPCHASDFDRTGKALSGPSPRDMDPLDCRLSDPDESGERWVEVRYQEFQTGVPQRRPLA